MNSHTGPCMVRGGTGDASMGGQNHSGLLLEKEPLA